MSVIIKGENKDRKQLKNINSYKNIISCVILKSNNYKSKNKEQPKDRVPTLF